jgi:hypothetical protein
MQKKIDKKTGKQELEKPKEKRFYTVEIECLIPAVVKYRVLIDEDEHEKAVLESFKTLPMERPSFRLLQMKRIVARVYDWGTNMLRYTKRF